MEASVPALTGFCTNDDVFSDLMQFCELTLTIVRQQVQKQMLVPLHTGPLSENMVSVLAT